MPATSALPDDAELNPGYVNYVEPRTLDGDADTDGSPDRTAFVFQKPHLDYFGIGYENYQRVIGLHSLATTFVLEGDIEPETVSETLVDSGYATAESHASYDLFDRADGSRTAAVGEDAIVWAHHDESATIVKSVVDAKRGAVERHHKTNEQFALLAEKTGSRPWTWSGGPTYDPTGEAIESMSYTFDEDDVYYMFKLAYPEGKTVEEQVLRDEIEQRSRAVEAGSVDLDIEGRVATIEMKQSIDSIRSEYDGVKIPQITWSAAKNRERVTIRHEAGRTVPANTVTFHLEGDGGRSPTDVQFADTSEAIEPGDEITVDVSDDSKAERIVGKFSPVASQSATYFVVTELP
jgi:hypothetical protein